MSGRRREGNRPDRRIADRNFLTDAEKMRLLGTVRYIGSGLHKLRPGDYGLSPPSNPRPSKSPCDELRPVLLAEAKLLLQRGIEKGMVSAYQPGSLPKYIWSVDEQGEVYEAKTRPERESDYHGYRIGDDETLMRKYVMSEWKVR